MSTRIEKDSMGEMHVPSNALYGASTQRAVLNFPISNSPIPKSMVVALAIIKKSSAFANLSVGKLKNEKANLIQNACDEIIEGNHIKEFVVDIFQTGSGTSSNMNANEVIANICKQKNKKVNIHPNDDVNMGQSSNDVFPTSIHIATAQEIKNKLIPNLSLLHKALENKQKEFWDILKIGRTHLMDATPIRLGQEFSAFTTQLKKSIQKANQALEEISELPLGGTAIGTGLNCHKDFPKIAIQKINQITDIKFKEAENHFEAQSAKDSLCQASANIKTIAISLFKIANDIRLLSSGPKCGIGEISLPPTQPGSSIMPGKVNPVMCESVMQVAAQVIGNDTTVSWCTANGNLQLNVMMPALAKNILESINLLANVSKAFTEKCINGITANHEHCKKLIEQSMSMVTSLAPIIGYDNASKIAKESVESQKTVRELCYEKIKSLNITKETIDSALNPESMTKHDNS